MRPYCREFLERMSSKFELVIFTAGREDYANKMIDVIDPGKKLITHRLYRQHCSNFNGVCIKDFRKFGNRKIEDMIIIDNYIYSYGCNLQNGIPIKPYIEGADDVELRFIADNLDGLKSFMDSAVYIDKVFSLQSYYDYLLRI